MNFSFSTSIPALILAVWLLYEVLRAVAAKCWREREDMLARVRLAGWALRPWAAWAALSVLCRNLPSFTGYISSERFPFYCTLWYKGETLLDAFERMMHSPTVLLWTAVSILVAVLILLLGREVMRRARFNRGTVAAILAALFVLAVGFHLAVACLPDGAVTDGSQEGSLLKAWYDADCSTLAPVLSSIKTPGHFIRHFVDIQLRLSDFSHGLSHPPGAAIAVLWAGKLASPGGKPGWAHYVLGFTVLGGLNVFIIYLLGRELSGSRKVGLLASLLWIAMPSVVFYATFSQDSLFSVFFNLALLLTWVLVTGRKPAWLWAVLLGADFLCLMLMKYSWCIATTAFAVFALATGLQQRWTLRRHLARGAAPLAVTAILAMGVIWYYFRLDYIEMFRNAREPTSRAYSYPQPWQWCLAMLASQAAPLLMLGSVVCSAFLRTLARLKLSSLREPQVQFLLIILCVHLIPVAAIDSLKMETPRTWNWVMTVPLVFAARALAGMKRPRLFALGALAVSLFTNILMRMFIRFL